MTAFEVDRLQCCVDPGARSRKVGSGRHDTEHAATGRDERGLLVRGLADRWEGDSRDDLLDEALWQPGKWRVRAHTARVRALIVVERALVVLGQRKRKHAVSIAEQKERDLGAGEKLLH